MSRLKIIYAFAKLGFEAEYWKKEIAAASTLSFQFVPFNYASYVNFDKAWRAQLLDDLYYHEDKGLNRLYADTEKLIQDQGARVLLVDTYNLFHPDYLKTLDIYKVLRIGDGPLSAYDRDIAYLHAFDHVLFHSPAYSKDMGMAEKLKYCGAKKYDFWPMASFDAFCDRNKTEDDLLINKRDVDVVFVGALHLNKMPMLAGVKKAFGKNMIVHGLVSLKKNLYFNLKYGFPGWVSPLPFEQYVPLYQRSKIGINIHNRGKYTVGGYRLFDLPANGVMQISDGGEYLSDFFKVGEEIESYESEEELIDKVKYYLAHDSAREKIARAGYRRIMRDHTIYKRLDDLACLLSKEMKGLQRLCAEKG